MARIPVEDKICSEIFEIYLNLIGNEGNIRMAAYGNCKCCLEINRNVIKVINEARCIFAWKLIEM